MQWLFRDIVAGGRGTPADFDLERYNARQTDKLRGLDLEALIARYRAARDGTIQLVEGMVAGDLDRVGRHAVHGLDRLERFVRWAYEHEDWHALDIAREHDLERSELESRLVDHRRRDLARRLARFEPSDDVEAEHRKAILELLATAGDPFARSHFEPGHVTASAFVLSPGEDALLLVLHGKLGRWLQPGGHVDPGDTDVAAAASRELREETGIELAARQRPEPLDLDVHEIPALGAVPAHRHYDVRFLFRAQSLEARAGSDARDLRWFPLQDIDAEMADESVMRAIAKLG